MHEALTNAESGQIDNCVAMHLGRALADKLAAALASAPAAEPVAPQASLIVDVYRAEGDDPFICAVRGKATIEVLTQIEEAIRQHADFGKGDGVYRYEPEWFAGQFGEYGQCELRPEWWFDEVGYAAPGQESLPKAQRAATRQYYWKDDACQAYNAHKPSCICWHDEGTGPHPDGKHPSPGNTMVWRPKAGAQ